VQPHFRARNALRGLNIIPREYVTRVNLRPRTPSRSAGMGGWGMRGDIFRLKCSYAGKSAEPAENSRSLAPASPSVFLFSPHVAAISLFRLSTLFPVQRRVPLATPTCPSTPSPSSASACASASVWTCPGSFQRRPPNKTIPRPRLSTSARHPRDNPRRAAPAPSPTSATTFAGQGITGSRMSGFYSELTLTGFRAGDLCGASRGSGRSSPSAFHIGAEESCYRSFGENRQDNRRGEARRRDPQSRAETRKFLEFLRR